jgi:molybdate transport system substrate-binding protein
LTTDSRNLNGALKKGDADLILNWRATGFFEVNRDYMDVIDLDFKVAKPKKLQLSLLTFSRYPEYARELMQYASSPEGQAIFRKYGFFDNTANVD